MLILVFFYFPSYHEMTIWAEKMCNSNYRFTNNLCLVSTILDKICVDFKIKISERRCLGDQPRSVCTMLMNNCKRKSLLLAFKMLWKRETVTKRCSLKKVFLKISENSQENTCDRVFFIRKDTQAQVFSCEFCENFKNKFFVVQLRSMLLKKNLKLIRAI